MRKFKQVKRKEVIFDLDEWSKVEAKASELSMNTSNYIRRMAVHGQVYKIEMNNITPVINAMRIIGGNINQIARKANEINSIYADDVETLRKESEELFHTLNLYLSTIQSIKRISSLQHSLHIKSRQNR